MKKRISILMAAAMMLTLAACGASGGSGDEPQTLPQTSAPQESTGAPQPTETQSATEATQPADTTEAPQPAATNVLVAYFSCTNTTRPLAQYVAQSTGADLYEITPVTPYSAADLDYGDDDSRSTREMNDPASRPEISGSVENMQQYDIVFIAYPIWWGEAPRIVSTFLESYDFSGKTIVPFCTSGGSGIGSSAVLLEELTSGATWLEGRRFGGGSSYEDMAAWVNSLGLALAAQ